MSEVVCVSLPSSRYLADAIITELVDMGVNIHYLEVKREVFPNGERYYRLLVESSFSLLGRTAIYIGALLNDDDILDIYRIGMTLTQSGIKRRVFVIPYLAYSTMDRASLPGEIVSAKCNNQMLSALGSSDEGNIFVFMDLHYVSLLHYFEGPCLRLELYCQTALMHGINDMGFDLSLVTMGSTNLRHASWVNTFANELNVPIALICEKSIPKQDTTCFIPDSIVGDVAGRHILIYDDIIRSGRTVIRAAQLYLDNGAVQVDVVTSHLTFYKDHQIQRIIDSPIHSIIATNTHPATQHVLIQSSEKFHIVDVSDLFTQCLFEMIPAPMHLHRASI